MHSLLEGCDGLNVCLPRFLCGSPTLTVTPFGREAFGKCLGSAEAMGGVPRMGLGPLQGEEETREHAGPVSVSASVSQKDAARSPSPASWEESVPPLGICDSEKLSAQGQLPVS